MDAHVDRMVELAWDHLRDRFGTVETDADRLAIVVLSKFDRERFERRLAEER